MNRFRHLRRTTLYRLGMLLAACTLALAAPAQVRADDPVETLRDALKINLDGDRDLQMKQRPEKVANAIKELKTITQLRRAYFLKEWPLLKPDDPALDVDKYRKGIGTAVVERIRQAGMEPNVDRQIAAGTLIAELADGDLPSDRSAAGKFAAVFSDLLIGGGKNGPGLVNSDNAILRQVAFSALGKITPKPVQVFPAGKTRPLDVALKSPDVGPRRLAAYALSDLIRNAHYLEVSDEMKTHAEAVKTAAYALSASASCARSASEGVQAFR